jgi:uncharacterized protein (DUF1697 family)
MTKHIALLRGINVGGNKKVSMAKLKELFQNLGFHNVSTYINSGNVMFESDEKSDKKLVSIIESGLIKHFGFEIPIVVRSVDEIRMIAKAIPESWQNNLSFGKYYRTILFITFIVPIPKKPVGFFNP